MLSAQLAAAYARVALANVRRAYPRRVDFVLTAPAAPWQPRERHPAFYGSYDWHSAVHMHWSLARLARGFPHLAKEIEPTLDAHLRPEAIARERANFDAAGGATFERPYGWAWLLKLQAELLRLGRAAWSAAVGPLAATLAERLARYIGSLPYPVRAGTHGNTAFACLLALDYAHTAPDRDLEAGIRASARRCFLDDRDYPFAYEPSGDEFLSPALVEALLMREVLDAAEFAQWSARFAPQGFAALATPPRVLDHADPKQSHLDGLSLSRAWCLRELGLHPEAQRHLEAGLPHVVGGDYAGGHWLVSFALLALSAEAPRTP